MSDVKTDALLSLFCALCILTVKLCVFHVLRLELLDALVCLRNVLNAFFCSQLLKSKEK